MDTNVTPADGYVESFEVESSTSTSIQVQWQVDGASVAFIEYFRVHYQKVESTYVQYGPKLPSSTFLYEIRNLVADTYYKVCLVTKRNDTGPLRQCVDASTTNWQLPVSIGSSIGAILALSIIVLIVLLSRCQIPFRYRKKMKTEPGKYDAISSNFHDERYFDFSETVTHGNDEEFTSDVEQEESGHYEPTTYDLKYKGKSGDKFNGTHGNYKTQISTRSHILEHKRHSLGRIYVHGHSPHRCRQMPVRAHSMQTDQHPCSPLAKESERRHSTADEWQQNENEPSRLQLNILHDMDSNSSVEQCTQIKVRPARRERILQKQISIHEQDNYISCSDPALNFLYIDDVPQPTDMLATSSNQSPNTEYNDTSRNAILNRRYLLDRSLTSVGEYNMNAFILETSPNSQAKPVEMKTQTKVKLLQDPNAIEEHVV